MCPQCLFACATSQFDGAASARAAEDEEILASNVTVGPDHRFLLLDKLGQGGMGEVWLAADRALSQRDEAEYVALKFLSNSIRNNTAAIAAIRSEVLRSQRLTHPHVVRIFDLHTTRSGVPFIKMEYVEGNSLSQWLRNRSDHVMPWPFVTQLTRQLAGALLLAHENVGIVHRDLKPANLLLAQGSFIKLSDFGLSQAIRQGAHTANELVGATLAYAGPQQLAGAPPMPADDIYSLGATLYELLTGEPPFEAETSEALINKIICDQPEPIPDRLRRLGHTNKVPGKLLVLVQRCLEKDPSYRPKTSEIARMLPIAAEMGPMGRGNATQDTAVWEVESKSSGRIANWFWTTASILALCGAIALLGNFFQTRDRVKQFGNDLKNLVWPPPPPPTTNSPSRSDTNVSTNTSLSNIGEANVGNANKTNPSSSTSGTLNTNGVPSQLSEPVIKADQATPGDETTSFPPKRISPAVTNGTLNLSINSAQAFAYYFITNTSGGVRWARRWYQPRPRDRKSLTITTNLPEGDYEISVTAGGTERPPNYPGWMVAKRVEIAWGATNDLNFHFYEVLLTVESDPANATMEWTDPSGERMRSNTPVTALFRTGRISFSLTNSGYAPFWTNSVLDSVDQSPQVLRLVLHRNDYPHRGRDFTNSLGMEFRWLEGLEAWASVMETRKADYQRFATDRDLLGAVTNMFTLTSNGWVQQGGSWEDPGFKQDTNHPVVGVNWHDATNFCHWLTEMERGNSSLLPTQFYTLPTTNEWQALAGQRPFPWGEYDELPKDANLSGDEAKNPANSWPQMWPVLRGRTDDWPRTAPARGAGSGPFNLSRLGDNVSEWCADGVLCGASWFDGEDEHPDCLRTAYLRRVGPDLERRDPRNGFRIIIRTDTEKPRNLP